MRPRMFVLDYGKHEQERELLAVTPSWFYGQGDYHKRTWFKYNSGYQYIYAMTDFGLFDSRRKQL